jgi:hypothetical protein
MGTPQIIEVQGRSCSETKLLLFEQYFTIYIAYICRGADIFEVVGPPGLEPGLQV